MGRFQWITRSAAIAASASLVIAGALGLGAVSSAVAEVSAEVPAGLSGGNTTVVEVSDWAGLTAAFAEVGEAGTVKLMADITSPDFARLSVASNSTTTLDLNGHMLKILQGYASIEQTFTDIATQIDPDAYEDPSTEPGSWTGGGFYPEVFFRETAGVHIPSTSELIVLDSGSTGTLEAHGGYGAAGIGSDRDAQTAAGALTVKSGSVIATGGRFGAGIGGGDEVSGSRVTVMGGVVKATGDDSGAGIGGGWHADGGTLTVSGGEITATGGFYGAGIGGGVRGSGGTVDISGGTVTGIGGANGAGIGAGDDATSAGSITVTGLLIDGAESDGGANQSGLATAIAATGVTEGSYFNAQRVNGVANSVRITAEIEAHLVSFDSQNGDAVVKLGAVDGRELSEPVVPSRVSYVFDGWFTEASGGAEWDFGSDTVTEDVTLYAHWTALVFPVSVAAGAGQVLVSWDAAGVPAGEGAVTYTASVVDADGEPVSGLSCESAGGTFCVITGLDAGASVSVSVTATRSGAAVVTGTAGPVTVAADDPAVQKPEATEGVILELVVDGQVVTEVTPGQQVDARGSGFAPNSDVLVSVYSTPVLLGVGRADAAGKVVVPVTIPADLELGAHTVVATGFGLHGEAETVAHASVQVVAAAGDASTTSDESATSTDESADGLAATGASELGGFAAAALVLLGAGAALVGIRRKHS